MPSCDMADPDVRDRLKKVMEQDVPRYPVDSLQTEKREDVAQVIQKKCVEALNSLPKARMRWLRNGD